MTETQEIAIDDLRLLVLAGLTNDADWYLQRKTCEEKVSRLYPLIKGRQFRNFVDVGANYGFVSLLARRAAPELRLLAIEADPRVAALIEPNFALNGLTPPLVVNAIAGDSCRDDTTFSLNPGSTLDNRVTMSKWRKQPVPTRTVAALLATHALDGATFFKIDTQGYEQQVLRGLESWLLDRRDWMLKMEFAPAWLHSQGNDPLSLLRWLAERFEFAEYPERLRFNTPSLDSLFDKSVHSDQLEEFLRTVISLNRNGRGWVDLIVRPRAAEVEAS